MKQTGEKEGSKQERKNGKEVCVGKREWGNQSERKNGEVRESLCVCVRERAIERGEQARESVVNQRERERRSECES